MKVILYKNSKEITSINFKAHEPYFVKTVNDAIKCLKTQRLEIPDFDTVIKEFISQEKRPDNIPGTEYKANVNDDVWIIDVKIFFCPKCIGIKNEVDNEGDLCRECR